jgi:hypothetical protein
MRHIRIPLFEFSKDSITPQKISVRNGDNGRTLVIPPLHGLHMPREKTNKPAYGSRHLHIPTTRYERTDSGVGMAFAAVSIACVLSIFTMLLRRLR